jgi:hypothetical protein
MGSNFPAGIDVLTNPTASDALDTPGVLHADQHSNANDAVEAIEAHLLGSAYVPMLAAPSGDLTGATDSAMLNVRMAAALVAGGYRTLYAREGSYHFDPALVDPVTDRGLRIVGASRARGTVFYQVAAGDLFTNGVDTAVSRSNGAMTAGSNVLTGSGFTSGSVGTFISVAGAGTAGAALSGKIIGFTSATQVTLGFNDGSAMNAATAVGPTATYTLSPWDANLYDGVQSPYFFEDIFFSTKNRATALDNGTGNYLAGSRALVDWRGGDIHLRRCSFEGFDTAIWGIQSDINKWVDVELISNHVGAYLGPRSDQFECRGMYGLFNDRVLDLDRVAGAAFERCQFVGNGAPSTNPVRIRSAWGVGSFGVNFNECWFEHLQGYAGAAVEAFVEIGVGDLVGTEDVHFRNPTILTNPAGSLPRAQYLVKCDRGDMISVENPQGQLFHYLDALSRFVGTGTPSILFMLRRPVTSPAVVYSSNGGAGVPSVTTMLWGALGASGGITLLNGQITAANVVGLTGGRFSTTASAATSGSGLRVPHGVAPTSPVDGDIWTTTAGMFVRINGVTKSVNLT